MEFIENATTLNSQNPHLIFLLLLPLFFLFLYKLCSSSTPKTNLPPSPRGLPVIGNLHQLTAHAHRGLHALSQTHGDPILLHLGSHPVLLVSSSASARHIMKTHDLSFASRPIGGVFWRVLYHGMDVASAPYGEYWRQIRSVCVVNLLSNSRVKSYSVVREEEVFLMVERMMGFLGEEVDLSGAMMELTNDVVCRVALGRRYGGEKSEFRRVLREFVEVIGGFYVGDYIPWLGWVHKVDGLGERVERLMRDFDEFLEGAVREHEECRRDGGEAVKDFVDVLLEVQRDDATGFCLERDSIKAIIMDMFAAGTDTTSTVLEWAMTELLRHPESMNALQAEVRKIMKPDHPLEEQDLLKMKYLKATIKECLRLHPPIPLLVPHKSTQQVDFNGYTIPTGTQVIVNAWSIQRDPSVWDEPDEFRSERFLESLVDYKGQDFELIPFGAGRRGCPGIPFAIATIELALASLVGRFDWGLAGGVTPQTLDMEETSSLTVHKRNPLMVVPFMPTF